MKQNKGLQIAKTVLALSLTLLIGCIVVVIAVFIIIARKTAPDPETQKVEVIAEVECVNGVSIDVPRCPIELYAYENN